ncbi:MAG: F0F1 ATP synthase subunit gamma [Planctomycetes bacterium]|nr:F0F1 ATP synthase subunit gamma [Planctomycetota bacterium]
MELSQIKARLESLQGLGELVRALRSMAASRTQEAQEALTGTRAYRQVVERAISEISPLVQGHVADAIPDAAVARNLLIITSEHGFVGGFNSRLIEYARGLLKPDEQPVIVGRRGQIVASEMGVTDAVGFSMTTRIPGVTALARRIARKLSSSASVRIVFARRQTGASFEMDVKAVVPLVVFPQCNGRSRPVIHVAPEKLLSRLTDEYLFAEIAHTLMESLASENAARLGAMDAASRNIDTKLERLTRDVRIAWQDETTSDMLDVVTGAEAANNQ